MKYKGKLSHIITVTSFVVFIVLGLACASAPSVRMELSDRYRAMPLPPNGNERIIDKLGVTGLKFMTHADSQSHDPFPKGPVGAPYNEYGKNTTRHKDELVLDQFLDEAKKRYPNDAVTIRNATLVRYIHEFARQTQSIGSGPTYTTTFYDCYPFYTADVVIAEPMPQPITYTNNITLEGQSRNDLYRRVNREFEDFRQQSARIEIQTADFDLGRIRGRYIFTENAGQAYIITAPFTVDVMDGSAQIRFENPSMQRPSGSMEEPIFLQSIADLVRSELVTFANNLISKITSR